MNITTEFCIFELVNVPNFNLNWQFWFLEPNLLKKSIWSKLETSDKLINSAYFKFLVANFSLKDKICLKKAISSKNRKSEQHHFKLVLVANFSLKWRFFFSGPNLPKKSISNLYQKKMYTTIKFWIFKSVYIPNFSLNSQFNFFGQIFPTKYFQSKTEKVNITNEFYIFESVLATNFS